MYKVITHTIKEEHFTHPATVKMAMSLGHKTEQAVTPESPFTSPAAIEYIQGVKFAMTRYNSALRAYLVGTMMGTEDTATLKNDLEKWAAEVGDATFTGYYPIATSIPIRNDFVDLTKSLEDGIVAIKNKQSASDYQTAVANKIDALATKLSFVNRFNWPKQAIVDILNEYQNNVFAQATARLNKDWTGDLAAYDKANQTLITGQPNGAVSLADLLSKGVVVQYQSKFH